MAVLPGTQFTQREPPGRTGQALWGAPPAGSGERIAEGVERLGGAVLAYSLKVQKQEQAAEYYEKRRLIDEAGWAAHNAVTGDEEADQAIWDKFQADARIIASSSRYKDVNDLLIQHLNSVSPNWRQGMRTASLKIRADNAKDQFQLNYTKALENGDMPTANEMLSKALELKVISQAEYDHFVKTAPAQVHLERAERFIAQGENSLALTELTKTDKMDLTTEQLKDKRVLKLTAEKAKDDNDRVLVNDVLGKIAGDMPLNEVLNLIQQTVGLDNIQKTKLAETAISGHKIWNQTGSDPFTVTQDWPKLVDTWYKIKTGEIKEFQPLYDVFRTGPENSPAFSFGYLQQLENLRIATTRGTAAAAQLVDLKYRGRLFDSYAKDGKIDSKDQASFREANTKLDAVLQQYRSDPVKLEEEFQKVLTERKEENAKGWLSSIFTTKPPAQRWAERKGAKYQVGDIVSKGGRNWQILSLTSEGEPDMVEEVR